MTGFAVDLVTYSHPGFWGCDDDVSVRSFADRDPTAFWDRILDGCAEVGVTAIELTFAPFDWRGLVRAYGSTEGVRARLTKANLAIASGFFVHLAMEPGVGHAATEQKWLDEAGQYAAFLSAMDSRTMVLGLPMRQSTSRGKDAIYDLPQAELIASICNRLGARVAEEDVALALHPEAHSVFCQPRDIDLLLLLTDPAFVGFCPDTAHIVLAGGDPVEVVGRHRERVSAGHWKDASGPMPLDLPIDADIHHKHRPYFRTLGEGVVDWSAWRDLWSRLDGDPPLILEIDAAPDPQTEIARSLAFAARLMDETTDARSEADA